LADADAEAHRAHRLLRQPHLYLAGADIDVEVAIEPAHAQLAGAHVDLDRGAAGDVDRSPQRKALGVHHRHAADADLEGARLAPGFQLDPVGLVTVVAERAADVEVHRELAVPGLLDRDGARWQVEPDRPIADRPAPLEIPDRAGIVGRGPGRAGERG